jgi:hypothetical protein
VISTPLEVVFLTPSGIRGFRSFFDLVIRGLKYEPNIQIWVGLFNGNHLPAVFRGKMTLGLQIDTVGKQEIWSVITLEYVWDFC